MAILDSTNDIEVITVQVPALTTVLTVNVPGVSGPANTLSIGTVSTGTAAASITGTAPNQVLNLTLPSGGGGGSSIIATTSTTSQSVAIASKVFTTVDTLGLTVGQVVRIWNTPTPANYMVGLITALSGTTLTVNVTEIGGSGTFTAWTIALGGFKGATGSNGTNNTLAIGTVTTLAAGASATATVTGTSPNQTLNLGIPQGIQGTAGSGATDATTTAKGSVQLAGDLAGTAASPTVVSGTNHTHTAAQVSNATTIGRTVLTAADGPAIRSAIGAGTSSLAVGTTSTDAKAGNYQPTAANISDATTIGRTVLTAADGPAIRTAIGAGVGNVTGTGVVYIVQLTAAAFAALGTKDSSTLYVIVG